MFTSKWPELNINFLNRISAPLTSAFNLAWGFPPRRWRPWCRAMVRIVTLLTTLQLQVVSRSGQRIEVERVFGVFCWLLFFWLVMCELLMNDDVDISYNYICIWYIPIYMFFFYIIYMFYIYILCIYVVHMLYFFKGKLHCLDEWMTLWFFVQEFDFGNMCPVRSDIYLSSRL